MRVLVLSGEGSISALRLTEALERDPSVSDVEASDLVESRSDADIVVIRGEWPSGTLLPGPPSGTCVRIVVADRAIAAERIRLLESGMDVVLHGEVPDDEIVAQVRAIARLRNRPLTGFVRTHSQRRKEKLLLDVDRRHALVLGRRVTLTLLEGNLLYTFMERPGVVLDSAALMTSIWGSPFSARSTVSAYIRRLRLKIEPDPSNPAFIRTVWGGGYVYRPEGPAGLP